MTSPLPTDEDREALDLDELERIAQAATQGAWTAYETMQADNFVHSGSGPLTGTVIAGPTYERANTAYIAAFDPPTVLALIAAARRSVVSTPSEDAKAILSEGDEVLAAYQDAARAGDHAEALARALEKALDALEASAVSAPPTITDDQIAVLAKYATELVKYVEADNLPFDAFHWAKSALRAALGGEA